MGTPQPMQRGLLPAYLQCMWPVGMHTHRHGICNLRKVLPQSFRVLAAHRNCWGKVTNPSSWLDLRQILLATWVGPRLWYFSVHFETK